MDLDSQSMTPPSSPIIGYSGCNDEQSLIDSGVIYCLNCKGAPRANDFSFSAESYILRREVISAVDNLRHDHANRSAEKPKLLKCFGHLFDPLDQNQIRKMMLICRKNVNFLEVLSESTHSFNMMHNFDVSTLHDDPEGLSNQNPWILRKNVCQFLNVIVRGLRYYRNIWKTEEFHRMFTGLKKSLLPINQWSAVLKTHSGFRSGNECTSATYHFFHLQLELRWCVYLIFGATPSVTNWLLDDLIELASFRYNSDALEALDKKQPFNCVCVKEIWTMIRLVTEHMQPEPKKENPFWSIYVDAMKRGPSSDPFFPIWLTSYLAQISDYDIAGAHRPGHGRRDSKENGNNAYQYIHDLFKEWLNRGGKSAEVLKLSHNFFQFWGGDCDILTALWTQWVQRLNQATDVSSIESYSKIDNWLKLISNICENSAELCGSFDKENAYVDGNVTRTSSSRGTLNASQQRSFGSNKDPFLELVFLVAAYARWANEREIRKLKSNVCMKLSRSTCRTNDYAEIGIIRVSSLFMALSIVVDSEREAVSMCERLYGIFTYGKGKRTPGRLKAILRAYSIMIIALLRRKISIKSYPSIPSTYMATIDELLSQVPTDPSMKDMAMVYIDLLDSLPKNTPNLDGGPDLGRYTLISSNLSMWFTNAGPNYVVRTARSLSQMTEWIVNRISDPIAFFDSTSSSEEKELYLKICEKAMPFMKSNVILTSNRIPSTDLEPLACLAADITLLTRTFKRSSEEFETYFDLFAMNEHTCPSVSQFYVQRLFKSRDLIESNISLVKWTQTWIRLVALDCDVPEELTEIVLNNGFSSSSNHELLLEFCKKANTLERKQLQDFLNPLIPLLKGVMSATLFKDDAANIINSVITSCTTILNKINLDRLYIRGSGVAVDFLNTLLPPWTKLPWETLSSAIKQSLERNLYNIFQGIALYPGLAQDMFLERKLQDIVALSFFGFVKEPTEVDRNKHPAMKITDLVEDNNISLVQHRILPQVIGGDQVVGDSKLCQIFLSSVKMFRHKCLATPLLRVLSGVIRAYCRHSKIQLIRNNCVNAVVYCCLVGSSTNSPFHRNLAVEGFKNALLKEFNYRTNLVFQLCMMIATSKNATNGALDARRFLKLEILPLLYSSVKISEERRGAGNDRALRDNLQLLEQEISNVPL